ncbi:capsular polysaccharide synthesis protein [Maritimibacter sp. 55A14]|uniref:capsular polysaccharide synthesis protein n=1 Tax=Maritimibacter sp. 55A14 TaxID=2174844 RepID=UPI003510F268
MLASFCRRAYRKVTGHKPDHFDTTVPRQIPKTVWMYWDAGESSAPELVQMCIASWRIMNPTWDVTVLDASTAGNMVDMPIGATDIPVQSYADLLRLRLLRQMGGVWADATTYCVQPLDCWLPLVAQRGFFAFTWTPTDRWFIWPGVRRSLTNWFLASETQGEIISQWEMYSFAYWENRKKPHIYFWPHLLFEVLTLLRVRFRKSYASIPKIGCYGSHIVHDCVTRSRDEGIVRKVLLSGVAPVQKLRWDWSDEQVERAKMLLSNQTI